MNKKEPRYQKLASVTYLCMSTPIGTARLDRRIANGGSMKTSEETKLHQELVDWSIVDGEPDQNLTEEEKQPWQVEVVANTLGITVEFKRNDQIVNTFFEINHGHPAFYIDYGGDNIINAFMHPDGVYVENGDGVPDHEVIARYKPPFEKREYVKDIREGWFFPNLLAEEKHT